MTDPKPTVWTERIVVRAYECSANGDLPIDGLCNYLQEAASNHATALGVGAEALQPRDMAWVLARLVVHKTGEIAWGSELLVETWPSGISGIFATRDFRVSNADGNEVACATTAWFLIDIQRRRPARLPDWVTGIERPDRPRALVDDFSRMPTPSDWSYSATRHPGRSDEDPNGHVNHVRYISWALDTLPASLLPQGGISRIEAHFRGEAHAGDQLSLTASVHPTGGSSTIHAISSEQGKRIADVRSILTSDR